MAYKIEDAFRRYLQKECTVYVVGDEYIEGVLSEIGDGWILIADEDREAIISASNIIYLLSENED